MADKKYLQEELHSQNINDKNSNAGMDYAQIGQEQAQKDEVIPKMTEEEQMALDEKRNDPKFQKGLQNILPTGDGDNNPVQLMDKAELNAKMAEWQKDIQPVDATQENNTGLPDKLKKNMEALSGISLDDVKVHYNSSKPAELNALAYAEGTDIYVGPGQEKHLPHEAWHVVQQKKGRVKPTVQLKGAEVNDDAGLEKEADQMGNKAIQMKEKANVNDDAGLESEADQMGNKATNINTQEEKNPQKKPLKGSEKNPIQRKKKKKKATTEETSVWQPDNSQEEIQDFIINNWLENPLNDLDKERAEYMDTYKATEGGWCDGWSYALSMGGAELAEIWQKIDAAITDETTVSASIAYKATEMARKAALYHVINSEAPTDATQLAAYESARYSRETNPASRENWSHDEDGQLPLYVIKEEISGLDVDSTLRLTSPIHDAAVCKTDEGYVVSETEKHGIQLCTKKQEVWLILENWKKDCDSNGNPFFSQSMIV